MIERHRSSTAFYRRWQSAACTGRPTISHERRTTFTQLAVRTPASSPTTRTPLTARELQVAELIADGLTNRQIAAHLVIALRTADNHVQHIFDKLGLSARAQVAAWVARNGLLLANAV